MTAQEQAAPPAVADDDGRWRLRHLPTLLVASAVAIAVGAVVGGLTRGGAGALGAAVGVALPSASFTLSTVVLAWADKQNPRLVLPFGVGLYVMKYSMLGSVMILAGASDWAGLVPFGWGVAAGIVVWTGVHIWWLTRVWPRLRGGKPAGD
ncbi:hypothetical protein [Phytohabitans suffuscus]|uniref:ATP synthase protein I n=1 Tax=Phytohabitans suffuscus TaxID=624315 RepID=A0A6F8YEX3_9ACTN|nr:hypothetical protein [Phytohabitans suffuscus]BCB84656.1 hypothetical protein Psuf_019690 [Phytohabitans suffuscus]